VLADSHVHLHAYEDVTGLLERARAAGVSLVVGIPVDLETSQRTLDLARSHPGVVAAVGVHPSHITGPLAASDLATLETLARDFLVGFVGEIGLDAHDARVALDVQAAVFQAQLDVARRVQRPVNLHLRGAFDEAFRLLSKHGAGVEAVVHYFICDQALARRALDLGLYLSVGKPVTRPENHDLRLAIADAPLGRLLLETDSYPLPGRTTEPRDVALVARAVTELKGRTFDDVAEATTANLLRLLGRSREDVSEV
jgi:TatD DNase family protein